MRAPKRGLLQKRNWKERERGCGQAMEEEERVERGWEALMESLERACASIKRGEQEEEGASLLDGALSLYTWILRK